MILSAAKHIKKSHWYTSVSSLKDFGLSISMSSSSMGRGLVIKSNELRRGWEEVVVEGREGGRRDREEEGGGGGGRGEGWRGRDGCNESERGMQVQRVAFPRFCSHATS